MPVNAFPGVRNWGYDGVFPSAVQAVLRRTGGAGPLRRRRPRRRARRRARRRLQPPRAGGQRRTAASARTSPTRTARRGATPSTSPSAGSDNVRRTFIESACRWIEDFHVDGLRLDAVHAIVDPTATPFLEELDRRRARGRRGAPGAPCSSSPRARPTTRGIVRPPSAGGIGCDAVWNDDVHHALRVALTGDRRGYYVDYDGVADLADGARPPLGVQRPALALPRPAPRPRRPTTSRHERFVVFTSNHDHVGNTPAGARPPYDHRQRLVAAATVAALAVHAAAVHGRGVRRDGAVPVLRRPRRRRRCWRRRGRAGGDEFAAAEWTDEVADPADPATFAGAVLDPSLAAQPEPRRRCSPPTPSCSPCAAATRCSTRRDAEQVVHARTATPSSSTAHAAAQPAPCSPSTSATSPVERRRRRRASTVAFDSGDGG